MRPVPAPPPVPTAPEDRSRHGRHRTLGGSSRRGTVWIAGLVIAGLGAGAALFGAWRWSSGGRPDVPLALAAGAHAGPTHYESAAGLAEAAEKAVRRNGSGRVTGTISGRGAPTNFNCDFTADSAGTGATADALDCAAGLPAANGGAPVNDRLLILPTGTYLQPPGTSSAGASWLRLDLSAKDGGITQLAEARTRMFDAVSFTAPLPAAVIDSVTDEPLDGAPGSRYELDVDLHALLAEAGDPVTRTLVQELATRGVTSAHTTLWVDAGTLPVRVRTVLPTGSLHHPGLPDITTTATFGEWGQSASISAPPPDETGTYPGH